MIADDFVGSGGTVGSLIDPKKSRLSLLLKKYPRSKIVVLIVAGFKNGLRQILNQAQRSEGRVRVISNLIFDEGDRCFTATSRILQNPLDRRLLCQYCVTAARSHYKSLPKQFCFGYDKLASIVVFSNTVPNNSLPLLWCERQGWVPLFPANGIPA